MFVLIVSLTILRHRPPTRGATIRLCPRSCRSYDDGSVLRRASSMKIRLCHAGDDLGAVCKEGRRRLVCDAILIHDASRRRKRACIKNAVDAQGGCLWHCAYFWWNFLRDRFLCPCGMIDFYLVFPNFRGIFFAGIFVFAELQLWFLQSDAYLLLEFDFSLSLFSSSQCTADRANWNPTDLLYPTTFTVPSFVILTSQLRFNPITSSLPQKKSPITTRRLTSLKFFSAVTH